MGLLSVAVRRSRNCRTVVGVRRTVVVVVRHIRIAGAGARRTGAGRSLHHIAEGGGRSLRRTWSLARGVEQLRGRLSAPGARLAARRFGGEAVLAYRLPSLFARGQLSRYGFRAAVVDYERSLSSLRAARAAVRQKARGAELAQGDTLASTLSAAAAKIQPTGRVTGCIPTQEYTCSTKNRRVQ